MSDKSVGNLQRGMGAWCRVGTMVFLSSVALLVVTVWLAWRGSHRADSESPWPSDPAMRRRFFENQTDFARLKDMISSEPFVLGVGPDYLSGLQEGQNGKGPQSFWRKDGVWIDHPSSGSTNRYATADVLERFGLSPSRHDEYLSLLSAVGGKRIEWTGSGTPREAVNVWLAARGIVPSGVSKHIVFFASGIPDDYQVVKETDRFTKKGEYYSSLGEGWYILRRCW
jgi:hypothetical protein